jgi:hypothetical protein
MRAIIYTVKGETPRRERGKCRKEKSMEEEMNTSEKIEELAKEVQTYKILEILKECKTIEEAVEKVKALLNR